MGCCVILFFELIWLFVVESLSMETLKGLKPEEETSVWMRTQQHASRDVDVRYGLSTNCTFKTRDIPLILCTYVHN